MADQPPVIIKKKKKGEGHHGGAWKVAYADFVTAMMALFIVLWILNQDASTKAAVVRYFKDPIGFSDKSSSMFDGSAQKVKEPGIDELNLKELEIKELQKIGQQIVDELSENPDFQNIMDQIKVEFVEEGLRIELLDSEEDIFFEVGTAELNMKSKSLIMKIGENLSKLKNKIVIEGHTDSRPYNGNGGKYTNFELSSDRANSARKALLDGKLPEYQIDEVRGYADRRLKDPGDPFNLVNRRISIIIKYSK